MVRRLTNTGLGDYSKVLSGVGPRDEWTFDLDGEPFRVINDWIGATSLFQGETKLVERHAPFILTRKMLKLPFLQAHTRGPNGVERQIDIYVRANFKVKIRVVVDGNELSDGFV